MFISEIFHSIQGEGMLTGVPSVFVRTAGCNLRCNWCDTMYASWEPEGENLAVDEIMRRIGAFPGRHVVLTGGEPMLAKDIHALAAEIHRSGRHITIETAGTLPPEGIACDLASVSPKLANSAPDARLPEAWRRRHEDLRWQPAVVRAWIDRYPYQLKYVVVCAEDLSEIQRQLGELDRPVPPASVLLMPEGTSTQAIRGRDETLLEICKRHGYRYCNRLHVELFGHRRGT